MHLAMSDQVGAGLRKMKFAINHCWRFDSVAIAWVCGFSQVLITISIEVLLYVLVIFSHDLLEVITVAVALAALAQLHKIASKEFASKSELSRRIIVEDKFAPMRLIKTTSSKNGAYG